MKESFEKEFSIEIPKLKFGLNKEDFLINSSFFEAFEFSPIREGVVRIQAAITKYTSHLDAVFHFQGTIELYCDRCLEPYPYDISFDQRVIFSYDEQLEFETDEVVLLDQNKHLLSLAKEFYDFINLQVPLRKVPEPDVHVCPPRVLEILGLKMADEESSQKDREAENQEEPEIDPRWLKLKQIKDQG